MADVFDEIETAPKQDVFDELETPAGDVFDSLGTDEAAEVVATPISGKLLGSETTPPVGSDEPEALPVMEKTDPLFPRVMTDVEAGQMVVNQFLLPSKVDAFSMLTQAERGGQVAVAEVRARQARERLNKIGPDPFNPDYYRAREEEQNLTARANALNLRFQADTPLGRMRAEDAERVQREEQMRKDFEASGEGPGVVGTFLEQVAGMATNVLGGALRTVAPSIGGAAGDAVIREGGRMTELANVDQSLGGQIGRGAGTVAGLLVGNPAGAVPSTIAVGLKGAMDAFSQTLQQTGNASEADRAAMHTFPALALYMATGIAGARAAAGMTPANAAPATKALAGFAGAAIANVGTTGAVALAEGTDYGIEELTADTLLAIFHAKGEYSRGVSEQARENAKVELLSRGFAEKQIDRPFELGENTPSFRVVVEPVNKPPPLMDAAAMQAEVDQVTSPPVLPVETEPAPTIEQVAEQHGMKYDGQTELPGNPHQFTDERTGSTIIVTGEFTPEKLTAKTEQLDQRFGLEPRERQLGPGAANIEEPIANREPVGAWNAKVDEQRAARGLEPLASEARRADETTWADAEKRMEENPNYARDLVDALNDGKKESVSDTEQAALLREMLTLREVRDMATDRAFDEQTYSPEERAAFLEEAKAAEDRLERTEEADRKSGTAQGRALRIRRLMAYEDFTLAGLMGKARRAKGEDLTPEETATLKTKADRFKKAKDKFEERMEEAETGQPIDEAIRQIEAEASKDPEFTPEVRSLADRIILKLEKAAKGASERLRGLMSQLGAAPDVSVVPKVIKELALMAASDISRLGLKATLKFTRWATKMVKEFGNKIEPYLKQAWDQANADIDNQVAGTRTRKPKEVKAAITKENAGARADEIATQMKAKGGKISEMRGDIQKLVETLVRGGIKQRDPLVDAVHEVLKSVDPAITRRQTADAISGYGDFKPLNKDTVKAEVRDLKQQLQLASKIEDVLGREPLKRSGIERQPLSDEGRALTKKLNDLSRELGIKITDPATQLKSILGALETRLTNRIKDLKAEIAKGQRTVKTKSPTPTNAKIEALRAELAQVEAQHEATFGKEARTMTDEQKIRAYKTRTQNRIKELETRIQKEDFGPRPKKPKLDLTKDPEAVKAKAEMERVRKEFNEKRTQWQRANRSVVRKFWDGIKEVAATSRSLITSADVSAPFRQGGFLLLGDMVFHPVRAAKQLGTMFRQLVSEKQFEQAQAAIMLRPNAKLYEQSGLYLADMSGKLSGREESMRSNLAEKIPLVKYIVRGSNRAYAGFLNRQRADTFDAMIESFGGTDKVTPEEAAAIADFVNKATGRGTVGGMERSADALARYFFSPRFLASRFQLVTGQPFVGAARRAVAQQYAKFAVGLSAIYGLALLNGATVEKDPRSADFGKAKFGDTRIDPLSGLAQVTTFLARMMSGKTKQGSNVKAQKRSDTFTRFARTKLAPIPGVAADFAAEKTLDFKKPTVAGSAQRLTVPLSYQDAPGVFKEHGAVKGTILEALNLMGMGLQRYNK